MGIDTYRAAAEKLSTYQKNIPDTFEVKFKVQNDWKFWEVMAFYLGGVGAGLYAVSHFLNANTGLIVGFILVVFCKNLAHLLSSSRPTNAFRAFSNPGTSWISRGTYFILFFSIFAALDIASRVGLIHWNGAIPGMLLSSGAVFFAFLVMVYIGFVMTEARIIPLWHSPLLPLIFLVYSVLLGAGLYLILISFEGINYDIGFFRKFVMATIILTFFLNFFHLLVMLHSLKAARHSVAMLTKGQTGLIFIGGALFAGLIVPLGLIGYAQIANITSEIFTIIPGILILLGGFLFESSFMKAGIYNPLIDTD